MRLENHREVVRVLVALMLSMFLGALDQTIVATALPSMARELNGVELLGWVVSAYLLSITAATPVVGKLSDLHGRRVVLRACVIVFAASSLLCALARNMPVLILGRLIQGMGGAGLITIAQATIADIIAPRERGRYVGYIAVVWASAGLIGPLLGGALTEYFSWRWIFLINLPLGALVLFLSETRLANLVPSHAGGRIAYTDVTLFAIGTTGLLLGLTWGGVTFPWDSAPVLGCFGVALAFGVAFALRQRSVVEPIIAPRFMRDPVTAPLFAVAFLVYGVYFAISVLVPVYLQLGLSLSPARAGAFLVPVLLSNSVLALWSGHYVSRTGTYRLPPLLGLPLVILALTVLGLLATQLTVVAAVLLLVVAGLGVGPILPIINVLAQNATPPDQMGSVTGAVAFFRMLGGTVLSAAGTAVIMAHVHLSGSLAQLANEDPLHIPVTVRLAVRSAFGLMFLGTAGASVIALVLFLMIEQRPLRSSFEEHSRRGEAGSL
jgi:MFS family permease